MRFSLLFLTFFAAALGCGDTTQSSANTTGGSGPGGAAGTGGNAGSSGTSAGGSNAGAGMGGTSAGAGMGGTSAGAGMGGTSAGAGMGGTSTAGAGGTGPCMPKTTDASKIGAACGNAGSEMCPEGYECWTFDGFAVQYYCAIICADTCECPAGTACTMKSDKGKEWKECVAP